MPFAIEFNPPIITVLVQGHLSEPPISIKVDLGIAGLPSEVSEALEYGHPHLLPLSWKRAFFAVLGDRYGAALRGMEGVVVVDTRPFLDLLIDIATQRIEFRLVTVESLHGAKPGDEVDILRVCSTPRVKGHHKRSLEARGADLVADVEVADLRWCSDDFCLVGPTYVVSRAQLLDERFPLVRACRPRLDAALDKRCADIPPAVLEELTQWFQEQEAMHDEERRQAIQEEEALADESDDDVPICVIGSKMLCTKAARKAPPATGGKYIRSKMFCTKAARKAPPATCGKYLGPRRGPLRDPWGILATTRSRVEIAEEIILVSTSDTSKTYRAEYPESDATPHFVIANELLERRFKGALGNAPLYLLDTILKCTLDGEFTLVEHEGFRYHVGRDSWKVEDSEGCVRFVVSADGNVQMAVSTGVRRVLAWAGGMDMSFHGPLVQRLACLESAWEYPDYHRQKLLALFCGKVEFQTSPMPSKVEFQASPMPPGPTICSSMALHCLTAGDVLMMNVGRFLHGRTRARRSPLCRSSCGTAWQSCRWARASNSA
jgi:hypothetical protein